MATLRFWIAGSIMFAWAWLAGHSFPNREQTARSAFSGFLLLVLGNAGVLFANRFLASSGIIAVLVAVTPFWIVLLQCGMNRANRPPLSVWLGILLGIVGMVVLVGAENLKILGENAPKGIAIVLVSTLCWAIGTLYTSSGKLPSSFAYNAGIQMFSAGICMGVLAILTNEWQSFSFAAVDSKAILSFGFHGFQLFGTACQSYGCYHLCLCESSGRTFFGLVVGQRNIQHPNAFCLGIADRGGGLGGDQAKMVRAK
jgi:drug/metabolite transporter (DMT)-like permease